MTFLLAVHLLLSFRSSVCLSNSLDGSCYDFDKTFGEYSLTPTNDLIRFCTPKVKVAAGYRGGEGIHVYTAALKSTLQFYRMTAGY